MTDGATGHRRTIVDTVSDNAADAGMVIGPGILLPSDLHPRDLSALLFINGVIEETGVTTVFSEVLASPALAETLSEELGLRTAVLDPIEGLAEETEDEDYVSLMRKNLAALQEANGCR